MILFRPVGLQELEWIYDGGMRSFPARLPQQPIFYPVLDLEYARQIASDWNAKNGQFAGYVTQFKVEDDYINKFETHMVGGSQHQEYWIPAEEVDNFNKHIIGHIKVLEAYFGDKFEGFVPEKFGLEGKDAVAQFTLLANAYVYKRMDFYLEIKRNHKAIFLNYPFWQIYDFKNQGLKEKVVQAIREAWLTSFPQTPLPNPVPREPTTVNQMDSEYEEDSPDEETSLGKQSNSRSLVGPVDEEFPRQKRTDTNNAGNPVPKDPQPIEQTNSDSLLIPRYVFPPKRKDVNLLGNAPEQPAPIKQTGSHFVQGLELGLSEKYREAIGELSKAVIENPRHVAAQISLGVAFHRVGEDDRALACYEAALKLDPKSAEAHYFRANILFNKGNVREAIEGYTTAIGLKPELIEAHVKPAPQDRLTDYTASPTDIHRIAKPARRILELNKMVEANPRQASLFKDRAAEYERLGNYEQAIADYSSSLEIQPKDANTLHSRGIAYEQIGQTDRALEDFQQASACDPSLSDLYINRGIDFAKSGNFRQAITSLTGGIRLAPKNPNGYFNRGITYLQLGEFDHAIADFTNVIKLSPNDELAFYWRGISYEETGRRDDAISDYKQVLLQSQDKNTRKEIEQRLSQWNAIEDKNGGKGSSAPKGREKTKQVQLEKSDLKIDLYELIDALGERALNSTWLGSDVNCIGEKAKELYAFTGRNKPIQGHDLLQIALGIRQTVHGDFQAFDGDDATPWLFIRAWEGNGFYIETNDHQIKKHLIAYFPTVEDVADVPPPYEGLFIHI